MPGPLRLRCAVLATATLATLATVGPVSAAAQSAAPSSNVSPRLNVDVTLTAAALGLTRGEGGGDYLRERAILGVLNTVAKPPGGKWAGDRRPEDDVYLLVFGRDAAGAPFARVVGAPDEVLWRVYKLGANDDGDGRGLDDAPVWNGDLADGEWVDLTIAILEYDGDDAGGQLPDGQRGREQALARLETVRGVALTLAERLVRGDSLARRPGAVRAALAAALGDGVDDVVGAATVRVLATGGTVHAEWQALDDARDRGHSRLTRGRPLKPRWFELRGDGATYHAHIRVSAR